MVDSIPISTGIVWVIMILTAHTNLNCWLYMLGEGTMEQIKRMKWILCRPPTTQIDSTVTAVIAVDYVNVSQVQFARNFRHSYTFISSQWNGQANQHYQAIYQWICICCCCCSSIETWKLLIKMRPNQSINKYSVLPSDRYFFSPVMKENLLCATANSTKHLAVRPSIEFV